MTTMMNKITLPKPQNDGGKPLMEVLKKRRSGRKYSDKEFDLQTLSNMLWASFGINSERGGRTAPSSHNSQEIDLYIFLSSGVYRYNALDNTLEMLFDEDMRALTGTQLYVATAPIQIAFIGNKSKLVNKTPQEEVETVFLDSGFISQNLYLFCASFNLRCVVRLMFDKQMLHEKLRLSSDQEITVIQSIGYPVE